LLLNLSFFFSFFSTTISQEEAKKKTNRELVRKRAFL
jgi:hypothetical protein